jgi:hypothetical protein
MHTSPTYCGLVKSKKEVHLRNSSLRSVKSDAMEDTLKHAFNQIDEILWNDWDPLGVNGISEARDEYHSYVWKVVDFKLKGVDAETITQYLLQVETVQMGLNGNLADCRRVSRMIINLVL